ncbi:MAG: glycosyltransferase, partial [Acidobacteria bacterium]
MGASRHSGRHCGLSATVVRSIHVVLLDGERLRREATPPRGRALLRGVCRVRLGRPGDGRPAARARPPAPQKLARDRGPREAATHAVEPSGHDGASRGERAQRRCLPAAAALRENAAGYGPDTPETGVVPATGRMGGAAPACSFARTRGAAPWRRTHRGRTPLGHPLLPFRRERPRPSDGAQRAHGRRRLLTPLVSIVVPTLNRRTTLEYVLPTLASQTFDPASYEVLVCDAGSTDGTKELVASIGIRRIRLVASERNGRSAARNAGIASARGELVLFNDADILADARLVEEHLRAHALHPRSAVVGCEVQVDSLEQYRQASRDPARRRRLHPHRPSRRLLPWWFFLTGNASVRRDAVLAAGGFDESFSGYGHEDIELGYRLERAGCRIHYHHAAVSYHWHPQSL